MGLLIKQFNNKPKMYAVVPKKKRIYFEWMVEDNQEEQIAPCLRRCEFEDSSQVYVTRFMKAKTNGVATTSGET